VIGVSLTLALIQKLFSEDTVSLEPRSFLFLLPRRPETGASERADTDVALSIRPKIPGEISNNFSHVWNNTLWLADCSGKVNPRRYQVFRPVQNNTINLRGRNWARVDEDTAADDPNSKLFPENFRSDQFRPRIFLTFLVCEQTLYTAKRKAGEQTERCALAASGFVHAKAKFGWVSYVNLHSHEQYY